MKQQKTHKVSQSHFVVQSDMAYSISLTTFKYFESISFLGLGLEANWSYSEDKAKQLI